MEMGQLQFSIHDYAGAVQWFERGFPHVEEGQLKAVTAGTYGYCLVFVKEYERALKIFDRYMAELEDLLDDETIVTALVAYGFASALTGDIATAQELLQRATEGAANSGNPTHRDLARQYSAAVKRLAKCKSAEDWKLSANDYFADGDIRAAICLYGVALKTAPHDAKILANRGLCYFKAGRLHSAVDDARRSMKADTKKKPAPPKPVYYLRVLCVLVAARADVQACADNPGEFAAGAWSVGRGAEGSPSAAGTGSGGCCFDRAGGGG
jgi:tetratricopeptide (TPR) repeat protein